MRITQQKQTELLWMSPQCVEAMSHGPLFDVV